MVKLNRITIAQLCSLAPNKVLDYKGQLMVVDHIGQEYLFEEPCRIDALTIMVCLRGQLEYMVNLERNVVTEPSILVNMPENIIQFVNAEHLEAYVVLISTELIKTLPYDLTQLANSYLPIKQHYHASVPLVDIAPLIHFYELLKHSLKNVMTETDEIVRGLLQAFVMSLMSLMRKHQYSVMEIDTTTTRGSRLLYEKFMDILSHYHQQERTVQFYADKLCVTPKYLSMVVKELSGRSPSDWISEYVIAEAKSLLHYQQLPIQEVAFRLNFPSQSSFGKFFKQKTGLSPMQYLKS